MCDNVFAVFNRCRDFYFFILKNGWNPGKMIFPWNISNILKPVIFFSQKALCSVFFGNKLFERRKWAMFSFSSKLFLLAFLHRLVSQKGSQRFYHVKIFLAWHFLNLPLSDVSSVSRHCRVTLTCGRLVVYVFSHSDSVGEYSTHRFSSSQNTCFGGIHAVFAPQQTFLVQYQIIMC